MQEIAFLAQNKKALFSFLIFLSAYFHALENHGHEDASLLVPVHPIIVHKPTTSLALSHPDLTNEIPYTVVFKGVDDQHLLDLFQEASQLILLKNRPPHTLEALRQRIFDDIPRLIKVLESEGYYDGAIFPFLHGGPYVTFSGCFQVILEISLGPRYHLNSFQITAQPTYKDLTVFLNRAEKDEIALGGPAISKKISDTITRIISQLANIGYPFTTVREQSIIIHEETQSMDVAIELDIGAQARFGDVSLQGLKKLDAGYILDEIPWEKNDLFNASQIDLLRSKLLQTNLFSSVEIIPDKILNHEGQLPILIRVLENKSYFIGTGLSYSSSEGGALQAFWGNRNLFGGGEKLDVTGQLGHILSGVETMYTVPHFLRPDQTLITTLSGDSERPDAYHKHGYSGLVSLNRRFDETWQGSVGMGYDISHVTQNNLTDNYHLPSLPLSVLYSDVNSILNPTKGIKAQWSLTPYPEILGGHSTFARIFLTQLFHTPVDIQESFIFSAYLNLGLMPHGTRKSVPPDKLFYAGGAGSVRGYGYQLAGPLDANNDPLGGSSAFESGVEFLTKITKEIGIVSFVDTGTVYNTEAPNFSGSLFWGIGGGIRYYTPIGPLRFDIAFPLHRRHGVDSAFQIYAGIGQSF